MKYDWIDQWYDIWRQCCQMSALGGTVQATTGTSSSTTFEKVQEGICCFGRTRGLQPRSPSLRPARSYRPSTFVRRKYFYINTINYFVQCLSWNYSIWWCLLHASQELKWFNYFNLKEVKNHNIFYHLVSLFSKFREKPIATWNKVKYVLCSFS